jgi:hypothetical protein
MTDDKLPRSRELASAPRNKAPIAKGLAPLPHHKGENLGAPTKLLSLLTSFAPGFSHMPITTQLAVLVRTGQTKQNL